MLNCHIFSLKLDSFNTNFKSAQVNVPMFHWSQEITTLPLEMIICNIWYTASTPQCSPSTCCIFWAAQFFRSNLWRRGHYGKLIGTWSCLINVSGRVDHMAVKLEKVHSPPGAQLETRGVQQQLLAYRVGRGGVGKGLSKLFFCWLSCHIWPLG